jgi:hypothetical protein
VRALGVWLLLTGLVGSLPKLRAAEGDTTGAVVVMINSADDLMANGAYLLKLTDPEEQKQWDVLSNYLEVFLIGVDRKLPTQIEVILGESGQRYVSSFPVSKLSDFLKKNLKPLGIDSRLVANKDNEYQLGRNRKQDPFNGFLLYAQPYAIIAEKDHEADLNAVPADPRPALKPLVDRNYLVAIEAHNKQTDAAAQAKRLEGFETTRKKTLSGLKKEKGETDAQFDFRKQVMDIQLSEAGLFFAESERVLAGMTIDRNQGQGHVDIELTPIADSDLGKGVAQLGVKASYFANVEKSPNPILSLRVNHPLTESRKKTALAMASLIQKRLLSLSAADAKLTPEQKDADTQLVDKTKELLEGGINVGMADGFADVHAAPSGKNTMLAAFRAADGTKITDLLNLFPKARPGNTVKLDVAEESGVKIHSLELAADSFPSLVQLIGSKLVYVGGGKDVVWVAAGDNALEALKAAIKKTTQPPASGAEKAPFAELVVKLKPWVEGVATDLPKKKTEGMYRKIALSAFQGGDDQLSLKLERQGAKIVGEIVAQKGLLRFAGKVAAAFSRENLDDSSDKSKKNVKK